MTTSMSPDWKIRKQSDAIASRLKAASRGDIEMSSENPDKIKLGIAMDDKIIIIEITWALIRDTLESDLSTLVFNLMKHHEPQN